MAMGSKKIKKGGRNVRREPRQWRARQTVEAILEAVVRIVKREGIGAVNTNRVAEVAGVSIGSVYQYFPDKRAMFIALHRQHIEEIDRLIHRTIVECGQSSLEGMICGVFDAMVDAHAKDPAYSSVIFSEIPHRPHGMEEFAVRLHGVIRLALAAKKGEMPRGLDLDVAAFVVGNIVDVLAHGAAMRRPRGVTIEVAREESVRAMVGYLRGRGRGRRLACEDRA
jgi:AcrR family transcriptional regulator